MKKSEYARLPAPSALELSPRPYPDAPSGVAVRAVLGLRNALTRLARALGPAEISLYEDATRATILPLLTALIRVGVPEGLNGGPRSVEQLARSCHLNADVLTRVLRYLSLSGYFRFLRDGRVAHSAQSRGLSGGTLSRIREFVLYFGSDSNLAAWASVEHALRTGESPFDHVHGANVWQWFDRHADEREMFAHAMMGMTTTQAPVIATLYPFAELGSVCDVGGGRGTLLSELLVRHPHLRGILCDGEGVLVSAAELLSARGVLGRVALSAGSFFDSVPAGADAYLLKNILHDWSDADCVRILQVVRESALPGARLLVAEKILSASSRDPIGRASDVQMMVACSGGRERSPEEYAQLITRAGFALRRRFSHPIISMLEAVAV